MDSHTIHQSAGIFSIEGSKMMNEMLFRLFELYQKNFTTLFKHTFFPYFLSNSLGLEQTTILQQIYQTYRTIDVNSVCDSKSTVPCHRTQEARHDQQDRYPLWHVRGVDGSEREAVVTEFTKFFLAVFEPLHQALLVDELDAPGADAGVEQGSVCSPLAPADSADI